MFFPLPTTISHLFLKTLLPLSHMSNNSNVIPFNPPPPPPPPPSHHRLLYDHHLITIIPINPPLFSFSFTPFNFLFFSCFHMLHHHHHLSKPNECHLQLLHIIHCLLIQMPCSNKPRWISSWNQWNTCRH